MPSTLILVNGLPGTGKSTLADKLSRDLALPMLGKDMLKEWLFDSLDMQATEENIALIGKVSSHMLQVFMEDLLADGQSVIAENAYVAAFAREELGKIMARVGEAICIEIYCTTDVEENRRRFEDRINNGARHNVHLNVDGSFLAEHETQKKYEPLNIGKTIQVDTTHFADVEYEELLNGLREELANA